MNQLETDLGVLLLHRSPTGVTLTTAGAALLDEARTIGLQGDVTDRGPTRLAASYRRQHPGVEVRIGEADLTDPTCAATCRLRAARRTRLRRPDSPAVRRDRPDAGRPGRPGRPPLVPVPGRHRPALAVVRERRRAVRGGRRARRPGTPASRALERHRRHDPARTPPARGAGRGTGDRHGAEPRGGGVEHGRTRTRGSARSSRSRRPPTATEYPPGRLRACPEASADSALHVAPETNPTRR
ncbi:hypothetical protein OG457_45260 [Streptomyces sp. NBC_01207]|nr:hypothetical protein OG457_45260 [Streptomyces sp. NBC_01207]WTA24108.1 hypothetical protein OG365_38965 [Streptomyces sp. NBC_00853]